MRYYYTNIIVSLTNKISQRKFQNVFNEVYYSDSVNKHHEVVKNAIRKSIKFYFELNPDEDEYDEQFVINDCIEDLKPSHYDSS
jgi:hypothetical protein